MKKILLVGLPYDANIGDQVIFDCTKKLLNGILVESGQNAEIISFDLFGRHSYNDPRTDIKKTPGFKLHRIYYTLFHYRNRNEFINHYVLKKAVAFNVQAVDWTAIDLIVFAGGGIVKYKYQDFFTCIDAVTETADQYGIPVMFSGVGIEGYDSRNKNCQVLENALNRSCVKMITTRDDIDTLKSCFVKDSRIECALVSDPACSVSKLYARLVPERPVNEHKTIGLGVCREGLFWDNNVRFGKEEQFKLWKDLYDGLTEKGHQCYFFTNGLTYDDDFAREVVRALGLDQSRLMEQPKTADELIALVERFDATIVCRLHASIISYSWSIPTVGIVWNDKQTMFGDIIGAPERFVEPQSAASYILEHEKDLFDRPYREYGRDAYVDSCRSYLKKFVLNYLGR